MQQKILDANGWEGHKAWAFGLGLERLAMVKFGIHDIRLFWTTDKRFTGQFHAGNLSTQFKPFSKFPPCFKVLLFRKFWYQNDVPPYITVHSCAVVSIALTTIVAWKNKDLKHCQNQMSNTMGCLHCVV